LEQKQSLREFEGASDGIFRERKSKMGVQNVEQRRKLQVLTP